MKQGCLGVLNAGSSSIKFAIYDPGNDLPLRFRGQIQDIGVAPRLKVADRAGRIVAERSWAAAELDHAAATLQILHTCQELLGEQRVTAIGHRVVHGGTQFAAPVKITSDIVNALGALVPLAPLHQPHNLAPIRVIADAAPHIAQVACFDTAFHRSQPWVAEIFAIPRALSDAGVRRYGFHGLSYEFVTTRLPTVAPELADSRVVIAHLGNGASLCAVRGGRSVASTMGFTAVDGLVMGTRCGSVDAGVILYLMDELKMDTRAVEDLIYKRSGLLGVSGISSDMRTLLASDDPRARFAVELFTYRIGRELGSLAAALEGLDALVFTGGIGERSSLIRDRVCRQAGWLGVRIDPAANQAANLDNAPRISADGSQVTAWVIPTDEEGMIARHTLAVLQGDRT